MTLPNRLLVLGLAMGFEEHELAPAIQAYLNESDLICGFPATLAALKAQQAEKAATHKFWPLKLPLEPCLAELEKKRAQGLRLVLVAGGDPLFYGLGSTLTRFFPREKLHILPATSALQLACARLALPVQTLDVLSLHGHPGWQELDAALLRQKHLGVLLDAQHSPAGVAGHLREKGCQNYYLHICADLGRKSETITHCSVDEALSYQGQGQITLILECLERRARPHLGLEEHLLTEANGYASSLTVRSTALALLAVQAEDVFWDIGSGSGAVALEAASLALRGAVWAVEARQDRADAIVRRAQKLGACNLSVLQGKAPDCLAALPAPSRIFVGGGLSGNNAQKLLQSLCQRLRPGGRLVISCVLLASFQTSLEFCQGLRWPLRILQVQASEARPLANNLHFEAENPVFLLCTERLS